MISRCSNPDCRAPFRYLSDGRLFPFPAGKSGLRVGSVCWHWLCGQCATRFTLVADGSGQVAVTDVLSSDAAPAA